MHLEHGTLPTGFPSSLCGNLHYWHWRRQAVRTPAELTACTPLAGTLVLIHDIGISSTEYVHIIHSLIPAQQRRSVPAQRHAATCYVRELSSISSRLRHDDMPSP